MKNLMKVKLSVFVVLALFISACTTHQPLRTAANSQATNEQLPPHIPFRDSVPKPSEMYSNITVSGRVSTLNDIEIYRVGQTIPYTYSHGKINNTPGYQWYVSKHFAMKTNFSEKDVRFYLGLLESSWPHYVELFGAEPPNIENQRITVVYSPSRESVAVPMKDDGFTRGPNGGGETMFYNRAGYSFKSSRKQHQRYIVIHETAHAFQMALMEGSSWLPNWFTEGTADALAHHIYDPNTRQLKVMNFDRGAGHDYARIGLEQYKKLGQPSIEKMTTVQELYRGINFLIVHFMLDDPIRSHYFKIYRDTMAKLRVSGDEGAQKSIAVLKDVFPDWAGVEKAFADYVANVDKTFNTVVGAWEQDGNAYWVRYRNEHKLLPRLDILLSPGDKPYYSRFKVDQLPLPQSALIGDIKRGVEQPSIGLLVDYKKAHLHRGIVGLGLGVALSQDNAKALPQITERTVDGLTIYDSDSDNALRILIDEAHTLIIDGRNLGDKLYKFAIPQEVMSSLQQQAAPQLGMTVKIAEQLEVVLRTGEQGQFEYLQTLPLTGELRDKLLNNHIAIFAEHANHRITPYVDDGRRLNPHLHDLTQPTAANVFRNSADREITRITKARWLLADDAPQSLVTLQQTLMQGSWPVQQEASHRYLTQQRAKVVADIATFAAHDKDKANNALLAFAGVYLREEWQQQNDKSHPVNVVLYNPSELPLTAHLSVSGVNADGETVTVSKDVVVAAGSKQSILFDAAKRREDDKLSYSASAKINWASQTMQLEQSFSHAYPWSTFELLGPARIENNEVVVNAIVRGPLAGLSKGVVKYQLLPSLIADKALLEQPIDIAPYEVKKLQQRFMLKPGIDVNNITVDVILDASLDGEPMLLRRRAIVQ